MPECSLTPCVNWPDLTSSARLLWFVCGTQFVHHCPPFPYCWSPQVHNDEHFLTAPLSITNIRLAKEGSPDQAYLGELIGEWRCEKHGLVSLTDEPPEPCGFRRTHYFMSFNSHAAVNHCRLFHLSVRSVKWIRDLLYTRTLKILPLSSNERLSRKYNIATGPDIYARVAYQQLHSFVINPHPRRHICLSRHLSSSS